LRKFLEKVLGLKLDLKGFYDLALKDKILIPLAERFGEVKPPRFPTIFEALISAVACQQLSLHVGIILLNRMATTYGLPLKEGSVQFFAFPRPQDLYRAESEDLRQLGFSFHKSIAIIELSRRIVDGKPDLGKLDLMRAGMCRFVKLLFKMRLVRKFDVLFPKSAVPIADRMSML